MRGNRDLVLRGLGSFGGLEGTPEKWDPQKGAPQKWGPQKHGGHENTKIWADTVTGGSPNLGDIRSWSGKSGGTLKIGVL